MRDVFNKKTRISIFVILLYLVFTVSIFSFPVPVDTDIDKPTELASREGWLTGWAYRRKHTIIGAPGAGTNYPIHFVVYKESGVPIDENMFCGGYCRNDFGDIRFTADDGITELNYWLEHYYSGNVAGFWVEVKDNLTRNVDIYVYYGNNDATTTSSPDKTFAFFDDFRSGVLNTSKWDTPYVIDGEYTEGDTHYTFDYSTGNNPPSLKFYTTGNTGYGRFGIDSKPINVSTSCQYAISIWAKGQPTGEQRSCEQWILNNLKQTYYRYVYTSTEFGVTFYFTPPTSTIHIRINLLDTQTDSNSEAWHDFILMRKYIEPGPTHSTWKPRETCIPVINHPVAIVYEEGTTGHNITWNPSDTDPSHYTITRNEILVVEGPWNGSSITVNIDGLSAGIYYYTCTVYDLEGYSASDTVYVTVTSTEEDSEFPWTMVIIVLGAIGVLVLIAAVSKQKT